jgi:hypothetical protein
MPPIIVEVFLYLPLISFEITILADSLSNSPNISLIESCLYCFDANIHITIPVEKTYGYSIQLFGDRLLLTQVEIRKKAQVIPAGLDPSYAVWREPIFFGSLNAILAILNI